MTHSDFGFSLSEDSVDEIKSLIEQYSQEIISIMNGFQDDLIAHVSTANYDKLLKAVDGITELYNESVRNELKTTILEKWQDACESMTTFAERMDMGEESEQVASEIEESLVSVFETDIENRLHEVHIDGRTSASIADFDSINDIFDTVVKRVQEVSDDLNSEAERLGEENEFYRFLIPIVMAYSAGICSYFKDAIKKLENLEDSYISKMAEKKDAVQESKQAVDLSSLLDFSDLIYAGMGNISQSASSEKKDVSPVADSMKINQDGEKASNRYEKLIKALNKFDGKVCTYPELKKKYNEHLSQFHKKLEIKVKAEYDKRDRTLQQYHKQLEQQLQTRHKELDGRYIKGTISLQQAEHMYAESCGRAEQLYLIKERNFWAEYQGIRQQANQMWNAEIARCNRIANKALETQQAKCRLLYSNRDSYIKCLSSNDSSCINEIILLVGEIEKNCKESCVQFDNLVAIVKSYENNAQFDGIITEIKQIHSPLNKELRGNYKRRNDHLTWNENLQKVNPNFSTNDKPGSENYIKFHENCQRCVMTYEARQRGFDVVAKPRKTIYNNQSGKWTHDSELIARCHKNQNGEWVGFPSIYKNPVVEKNTYTSPNDVIQDIKGKMKKYGKDSRMVVGVQWLNGGGHVFIVENVKGTIVFCDPQTGKSGSGVEGYFNRVKLDRIYLMRTDNLEFSDLVHECFQ